MEKNTKNFVSLIYRASLERAQSLDGPVPDEPNREWGESMYAYSAFLSMLLGSVKAALEEDMPQKATSLIQEAIEIMQQESGMTLEQARDHYQSIIRELLETTKRKQFH